MKRLLGCAAAIALSLTPECHGTVVYVDDSNRGCEDGSPAHPWNTVQEGINGAAPGDEVAVAEGRYTENVAFKGGIFLRGGYDGTTWQRNPGTRVSELNGEILAEGNVSGSIEGFTINGSIGMLYDSAPGVMTICDNRIRGMTYDAISIFDIGHKEVIVRKNYCSGGPGNGFSSLYFASGTLRIENNVFCAMETAGIVVVDHTASVRINNNTIDNNAEAGIVYMNGEKTATGRSYATCDNNSVTHNGRGFDDDGTLSRDYNDVWGNGLNYYSIAPPGPHDISRPPCFVDPAHGNYRLFPGGRRLVRSPCIDAGVNVGLPYWGAAPDMGAYECSPYLEP